MYFRYESTSHNGDGTAISTWLSEQREGQTAVPSFVSFFFFATFLLSLHSPPSALILPWGDMIWEVVKFFFPYLLFVVFSFLLRRWTCDYPPKTRHKNLLSFLKPVKWLSNRASCACFRSPKQKIYGPSAKRLGHKLLGGAQAGLGARERSDRRSRRGIFSLFSHLSCVLLHTPTPNHTWTLPITPSVQATLYRWWLIFTTENTLRSASLGFQIAQMLRNLRGCYRLLAHTTLSGLGYRSLSLEPRSASQ